MDEYGLEELIDRTSLTEVLRMIEEICYGKAEHVMVNWQDKNLSRAWTRAAAEMDKVASRVNL